MATHAHLYAQAVRLDSSALRAHALPFPLGSWAAVAGLVLLQSSGNSRLPGES